MRWELVLKGLPLFSYSAARAAAAAAAASAAASAAAASPTNHWLASKLVSKPSSPPLNI